MLHLHLLPLSAVAPTVTVLPSSLNATLLNNSIILSCNASGFPVPTISWLHDGFIINESDPKFNIVSQYIGERSVLSIFQLNASNVNDSGKYVCSASNSIIEFDIRNNSAIVLVQGRYNCDTEACIYSLSSLLCIAFMISCHDYIHFLDRAAKSALYHVPHCAMNGIV